MDVLTQLTHVTRPYSALTRIARPYSSLTLFRLARASHKRDVPVFVHRLTKIYFVLCPGSYLSELLFVRLVLCQSTLHIGQQFFIIQKIKVLAQKMFVISIKTCSLNAYILFISHLMR